MVWFWLASAFGVPPGFDLEGCANGKPKACDASIAALDRPWFDVAAAQAFASPPCEAGDEEACALLARLDVRQSVFQANSLQTLPNTPAMQRAATTWLPTCEQGDLLACSVAYEATVFLTGSRRSTWRARIHAGLRRLGQTDPDVCRTLLAHDADDLDALTVYERAQACEALGAKDFLLYVTSGWLRARLPKAVRETELYAAYDRDRDERWAHPALYAYLQAEKDRRTAEACSPLPKDVSCGRAVYRVAVGWGHKKEEAPKWRAKAKAFCNAGVDALCGFEAMTQEERPECRDKTSCAQGFLWMMYHRRFRDPDNQTYVDACIARPGPLCALVVHASMTLPKDFPAWACNAGTPRACRETYGSPVRRDLLMECRNTPSSTACTQRARWAAGEMTHFDESIVVRGQQLEECLQGQWYECDVLLRRNQLGRDAKTFIENLHREACASGVWPACEVERAPDAPWLQSAKTACSPDDWQACMSFANAKRGDPSARRALVNEKEARFQQACEKGDLAACEHAKALGSHAWDAETFMGAPAFGRQPPPPYIPPPCEEPWPLSFDLARLACEADDAAACAFWFTSKPAGGLLVADRRCDAGEPESCLWADALAKEPTRTGLNRFNRMMRVQCIAGDVDACATRWAQGDASYADEVRDELRIRAVRYLNSGPPPVGWRPTVPIPKQSTAAQYAYMTADAPVQFKPYPSLFSGYPICLAADGSHQWKSKKPYKAAPKYFP